MKRLALFKNPAKLLLMLAAFTFFCAAPRAEAQYCEPNPDCSWGDRIEYFLFNEIENKSSGECNNGYADYTDLSTTLDAGQSYYFYIDVGYDSQSYTIWIDFNDNNAFEDDEIVFMSESDDWWMEGDIQIPADAPGGEHRMRVMVAWGEAIPLEPCTSYGYGETEDYTVNIKPNGVPNDAAITGFTSPVAPFTPGAKNVTITLKNAGSNNLTSANINWAVNGVAQTAYSWSGSLAAGGASAVTLGSYNFADGNLYTINATIASANGTTDGNSANNSLSASVAPALSGSYTVGGAGSNFTTLADAVAALNNGGMTGPVTINVRPGTYTGQVSLNETIIGGATAARPIVIQSENGNPSSVVLQYSATSAADNYVIRLNGTDYVTIRNMTISATGTSGFGSAILLTSATSNSLMGSDNVTIEGNILNGRNAATTALADVVVYAYGNDNHDNLRISGNTINNGSLGIFTRSWYTNLASGLRIENNLIQNAHVGGIRVDINNGGIIAGNTIIGKPTGLATGGYYIWLNGDDNGMNVERNTMRGMMGGNGILFQNLSGYQTNSVNARVANNSIEIGGGSANEANGININNRPTVNVYHNTVRINSTNSLSDALEITTGTTLDVRNNILINAGAGRALNANNNFGTAGYNDLVTTGSVLATYMGTNYSNLAAFQATDKAANSISILPVFASPTDLHIVQVDTRLFGLAGLATTDIDNETRRNYYMGADEVIPTITINTQPLASSQGCFGNTTVLSVAATSTFNSVKSYQWQKNGSPIFDNGNITGTTTPTLRINNTQLTDAGIYAVRITDNSGATPVISTTTDLIVDAPIVIVRQPQSQIVCPGSEAILSLIANGTVNGIQWQKEDPNAPTGYSNISGATTPQIFFASATQATSGKYRALLFGTCGTDTVITDVSALFVGTPTFVARQVENEITRLGGTASLSVEAQVAGNPTTPAGYQWYRNGTALTDDSRINGSRSSVLTISGITSADTSATYYASVTGLCGTAQSNTAKIVIEGINITSAPEAVSVCAGDNASMTVSASGTIAGSSLSYQWMRGNTTLTNSAKYSGVNTPSLTIANVSAADAGEDYRVRISTVQNGTVVFSDDASLTVNTIARISGVNTTVTVCEGNETRLFVETAGQQGLNYFWFKNGAAIGNDSVLVIPSAQIDDASSYHVRVENACGSDTVTVVVVVNSKPTITAQPQNANIQQGGSFTLSVAATGTGNLQYQWMKAGEIISGATLNTYEVTNADVATHAGLYTVKITNNCGDVTSAEARVDIVNGIEPTFADGFSLEANEPNPFGDATTIRFTLVQPSQIHLFITDAFGREVATLANGMMDAGTNAVTVNSREFELSSGVYYYTLRTGSHIFTRQMVIVR